MFLHGLARTHRSLSKLRRQVEKAGYPTWARTYPSRRLPVGELADQVTAWICEDLGERAPVCAVTHSLGGIIVRFVGERVNWQRIVMLAPPNRGSRVAAALSDNPLFSWYFGPASKDVSAAKPDPEAWPMPTAPFAVIAGTKRVSMGNLPSWVTSSARLIPKDVPSDGTVCVEETHLRGMADYAELPASHTWIMNHQATAPLVLGFLERGTFEGALPSSEPDLAQAEEPQSLPAAADER